MSSAVPRLCPSAESPAVPAGNKRVRHAEPRGCRVGTPAAPAVGSRAVLRDPPSPEPPPALKPRNSAAAAFGGSCGESVPAPGWAEAQLCPTPGPKDRGAALRNLRLFSPRPSRAGPSRGMNHHKGRGARGQLEPRHRHKDRREDGARSARQLLYRRLLFPLIKGTGPEAASVSAAATSPAPRPGPGAGGGATLLPSPAAAQTRQW